jgi:hypothetical protein
VSPAPTGNDAHRSSLTPDTRMADRCRGGAFSWSGSSALAAVLGPVGCAAASRTRLGPGRAGPPRSPGSTRRAARSPDSRPRARSAAGPRRRLPRLVRAVRPVRSRRSTFAGTVALGRESGARPPPIGPLTGWGSIAAAARSRARRGPATGPWASDMSRKSGDRSPGTPATLASERGLKAVGVAKASSARNSIVSPSAAATAASHSGGGPERHRSRGSGSAAKACTTPAASEAASCSSAAERSVSSLGRSSGTSPDPSGGDIPVTPVRSTRRRA